MFAFRADLQAKAGGNPSWNTGVNYYSDFGNSADRNEVAALYKTAGLNLTTDLQTLSAAPRVSADPNAVSYLSQNVAFDGQLSIPMLTMHTTGDGLVVPENEQAYGLLVDQHGNGLKLRQIFVNRAGHCAFTPAETITAVQTLMNRVSTGAWGTTAPQALNAQAQALGPQYNIFLSGSNVVATAPGFTKFITPLYLRPYNLRSRP